jgi:hypothetical protein
MHFFVQIRLEEEQRDLTRERLMEEGRDVDRKNAATFALAARECQDKPGKTLAGLFSCVGLPSEQACLSWGQGLAGSSR